VIVDIAKASRIALGWRLVHEGCCGQAHVMPPATRALARREVA
jgi:hypothetical protein